MDRSIILSQHHAPQKANLEILDGFTESKFWYVDQGIGAPEAVKSVSFRKAMQRQDEKWWLSVPRVPPGVLSESTRKRLNQKLECASQILKAASAINSSALAEMDVPRKLLSFGTNHGGELFVDGAFSCSGGSFPSGAWDVVGLAELRDEVCLGIIPQLVSGDYYAFIGEDYDVNNTINPSMTVKVLQADNDETEARKTNQR